MKIPVGYILSGGRSSRFGSDKARHVVGGKTLLEHSAEVLSALCGEIAVVGHRAGEYEDLGFRTIADLHPGLGPMAGIEAASADAAERCAEMFAVVTCDRVGLRPEWIDLLAARLDESPTHLAAAFRHADFWEPFPLACRPGIFGPLRQWLDAGKTRLWALLDECCIAVEIPAGFEAVVDANRPGDLRAIGEKADALTAGVTGGLESQQSEGKENTR